MRLPLTIDELTSLRGALDIERNFVFKNVKRPSLWTDELETLRRKMNDAVRKEKERARSTVEPWKARLLDEYEEASDCLSRLEDFLKNSPLKANLSAEELSLFKDQAEAMPKYIACLQKRLKYYGIKYQDEP